jgi:hypothetical protein
MKLGLAQSMYTLSTYTWTLIHILQIASHCNLVYDTLLHTISICDYLPIVLLQYQMLNYQMQDLYPWI